NEGYAAAWLGERSPLRADALTVSGYLGVGALAPFVTLATETSRGVFVLAATSNDAGGEVQLARRPDGRRVQEWVIDEVAALNGRDDGRGSVGVVIGATRDAPDADLARLGGPVLVPGLGAQGAGPADAARVSARCARDSVLGSVSRGVADAGPGARPLGDAAARWRDDLAAALA
ncbi:MAG TPA: orotidine-5'-phosphate decarboxylase, partial [Acidimicrobiales bacterium]|nr:orotidine-5'-phosphate decarboxylase [Acidimicrobiales bacterium]